MIRLTFDGYDVVLAHDSGYQPGVKNNFKYDLVYHDEDATIYESRSYAVKVFKGEELYKSAVICAFATAVGIHKNSAVIVDEDILVCCADKVSSLSLPDLKLNWMRQIDEACCFQIFKNEAGIFVHGELSASRIDKSGNIVWSQTFADILVTLNGRKSFIMHDDFIEIEDWAHNKYKLNFDGNFI